MAPNLKMFASAFYLPKNNPNNPKGEDAHFLCLHRQTLGIADGVGGWARHGIDAGVYSRQLMQNANISVLRQPKDSPVSPRTALNEAFSKTEAAGSSTAIIATLKNNTLHAVNVGDSGFMVFRNKKIIFKSPTQQHGFNHPFQLGNDKACDTPSSAVEFSVGVKEGDVIVFGSDGFFDNVYVSEMEEILELEIDEGRGEPHKLANVLADLAYCNSVDKCNSTPFQDAARLFGINRRGDKKNRMIMKRRRSDVNSDKQGLPAAKKPNSPPPKKLKMVTGTAYQPKDNPNKPLGEDAHFTCDRHQTLGLADGVGGWARVGIDAGEYARGLMRNATVSVLEEKPGSVNPRTVLSDAFLRTRAEGSSTACIATLRRNLVTKRQVLHVVNVGDSGFMVLRDNKIVYRSRFQQHRFNSPYQLGRSEKCDKPECCEEVRVKVQEGDVVVFGTDGLFDNVYGTEIQTYVTTWSNLTPINPINNGNNNVVNVKEEAEGLAWELVEAAYSNSISKSKTPFEEAANKAGKEHEGGKADDITVIVAYIVAAHC